MAEESSLPTPAGTSREALERAKQRSRQPIGGAPPVKMPDFSEVEAKGQRQAETGAEAPERNLRRPPEEIRADLEKLNQAVKDHNSGNRVEDENLSEVSSDPPMTTSTADDIEQLVDEMDDFELDGYRRMLVTDTLNNERRKKTIEGRCKPMNIVDLITQNEVIQVVPIVPGKFEPAYRSVSAAEDLEVKRMLYSIRRELPKYQMDAYSVMSLTLAIHAINGHPLPSHLDSNGDFDETLFRKKFTLVKKYPLQMIADLGVNYIWFDLRVKKLFTEDTLGNG